MNTVGFVSAFRRASIQLMDALDEASNLIDEFNDLGVAVTLDPYFNNTTPDAKDPLVKQDILDAGAAIQAVLAALGTGPATNRAKLNKLR